MILNRNARIRLALKESGVGKGSAPVDLDEGTLRLGGPRGRMITQAVSRLVFDETEAAGIRYTSRLDVREPLWAVFDWVEMLFSKAVPINLQDPALRSAAMSLGFILP